MEKRRKVRGPSRTTKEAKDILNAILFGEIDNIKKVLTQLRLSEKDRGKYLECLTKLLQYSLPKKTDVTSDDEQIKAPVNIIVSSPESGKKLKEFIDGVIKIN